MDMLTHQQLVEFNRTLKAVLKAANGDYPELLRQLYFRSDCESEEFERFVQILNDASDPDFRSPK